MSGRTILDIKSNNSLRAGFLFGDIPIMSKITIANMSISSLTHFYHKPYALDWNEAREKALNMKGVNKDE